ncbi:hypothetical protein [uncultured Algibacter sp.]|uniref:hypothetical protein n=1 Tax=uncultured Algibacter sp. TaxID=298659 RepID=UPI0032174B8E
MPKIELDCKEKFKFAIIFYHLTFCFASLYYSFDYSNECDAENIFRIASEAENINSLIGIGTIFISFLIYPLIKIGFNYILLTILFSVISLKGFLIYGDMFFKTDLKKRADTFLFIILFFLPSYHFWTSFVGKDAVVFYLMAIVLSNVFNMKRINLFFITSIILILVIRPYIFFILLLSYLLNFIFNPELGKEKKIKVILFSLAVGFLTLPILQKFLKLEDIKIENIKENYNRIILYSQRNGNSSINLEKSSYLERLMLVLFRPFFYESIRPFHILASIENTIVWLSIIKFFTSIKRINLYKIKEIIFPVMAFVLLILFYSVYMYNLGLASRMRVMYMPYMLFSIYWIVIKHKN